MAAATSVENQDEGEECCVCLITPPIEECRMLPCTHTLCESCVRKVGEQHRRCPLCRIPFRMERVVPVLNVAGSLDVFCFDTSSSMWWSDWFIPLFGWSRLHVAQAMAEQILRTRRTEHVRSGHPYSVCISRFDNDWCLVLAPTRIRTEEDERTVISTINGFTPNGSYTAFFDSYLRLCDYLEAVPRFRPLQVQVFFFTDGQNNLSVRDGEAKVPDMLRNLTSKLHLMQYVINIGGDVPRTRGLADKINAEFIDVTGSNYEEKARAITLRLAPIRITSGAARASATAVGAPPVTVASSDQQSQSSQPPHRQQQQRRQRQVMPETSATATASALERLPPVPTHDPANTTPRVPTITRKRRSKLAAE